MGIDKNFPLHPYEIIDPAVRWFPGSDSLSNENRGKLLPPLVDKIRLEVKEWRDANYPNISEVSRSLLNFWFKEKHKNGFEYYFAQRESVETIIYLYENKEIRALPDLLRFDSSGSLYDSIFEEAWLRFVVKQATGTGKTKVFS